MKNYLKSKSNVSLSIVKPTIKGASLCSIASYATEKARILYLIQVDLDSHRVDHRHVQLRLITYLTLT